MKTVTGLFERTEDAERAVNEMAARGYDPTQIEIIARDQPVQEHMQQVRDVGGPTKAHDQAIPRQVATGAAGGSALGGIAGLLGGIAAVVIPGIGPVVGAETIVGATLLGAGLGAGAGAAAGGLFKLRVPEHTIHLCIEGVNCDEILLTITVIDGLAGEVESIFRQNLVQDITAHRVVVDHLSEPPSDMQMPNNAS
jgi:hypothetical protein